MRTLRLLALTACTAVGVTLVPASAAPPATVPATVPAVPVGSPAADCRARVAGLDLQTATVEDLAAAMTSGRLTSERLVQAYLDRIAAYDGPTNSVRHVSATALEDARRLDRERARGDVRGPLHGVPVLLKDNIGTGDMPTTAGSIALEGLVPYADATLTARLREEGAVVLGKANLSEFANWVSLSMPNGYSSLGGQVREAYGLGDPSGSSSGSGVAGSLALAAGTFGSETSGSILSPSDVNGLVGLKPTRGLVSRAGVIPLAEGFDTAGPMTRSVADAAALLTAVAGSDPRDPATLPAQAALPADGDYTAGLGLTSLEGVRLGYSADRAARLSTTRRALYATALQDLRDLGAELVDTDALEDPALVGLAEIGLIPNDFKANLDHYLRTEAPLPRSGVRSLAEIVAYNQGRPEVRYGQDLLLASAAQPGSRTAASAAALALRTSAGAVVDRALGDLDAIVGPGPAYANIGAAAGYPTVIVPMGLGTTERPAGISFLGTAWDEADLLEIADAYERATQRRVPPTVVNEELLTGC